MAKNLTILKGNLTRDPFFDYLAGKDSPVPFMRFTLAVDRHPPRREGADYLPVVVYGPLALNDHPFLHQGSEILVEGWLRTRDGTDERGDPALRIEVVAEEITFLRNIAWEATEQPSHDNEAWASGPQSAQEQAVESTAWLPASQTTD